MTHTDPPASAQVTTTSPDHTQRVGAALAGVLRPGDVLALEGELGAGKTCLVRGLASGLGIDPARISSPTFVLAHVHPLPLAASPHAPEGTAGMDAGDLVHVDAYRLSGPDDLEPLGWDRLADGRNIVVIEWATRVEGALPASRLTLRLEHVGEEQRRLTFEATAARIDAIRTALGVAGSAGFASPTATHQGERPVRCRTCGGSMDPRAESAPFCSERCRLADLGRWFSGSYRISRQVKDEDLDSQT